MKMCFFDASFHISRINLIPFSLSLSFSYHIKRNNHNKNLSQKVMKYVRIFFVSAETDNFTRIEVVVTFD